MNKGNLDKIKRQKTLLQAVLFQTQPNNDTINVFGGKQSVTLVLVYWSQLGLNIYINIYKGGT